MNKIELIKKYLKAKSLADGYLNINNPSFNNEYYQKLESEVKILKKELEANNISQNEIEEVRKEMEEVGEYLER